ncbi:MAG TPA: LysR family transcriptional regulator [Solirubrobacterales bacterium]|jgi:DNA-binding transcriptional LysR family regulator|nr:LysR family transcriptional regulator [Solirubrobacterales bacterium]
MSTQGRQDLTTRGRRSIRGPEIAELRAFCAAVDLGTLGKAAVSLKISQPALSKRLRALEAAAGAKLLERSRRGVVPTAAGRRLYPEARRLLDQADVVERVLESAPRAQAPIELAVSHTIAEFFLPPELVAYQADGRRPSVQLTIANSGAVRLMVAEGRASIGIAAAGPEGKNGSDDLEELELLGDEVVLAVPQDHAWYRRKSIPEELFLSTPMVMRDQDAHVRQRVEEELAERGLTLADPLIEAASTAVAKREALERSAPVLLSSLSLDETRDRLYRRPITGLRFPRRFVVVCRSLASLPRHDRDFVDFLRRRRQNSLRS